MSKCLCGRSPTDECVGWHGLTKEQYEIKLYEYNSKNIEVTPEEEEEFSRLEKKYK